MILPGCSPQTAASSRARWGQGFPAPAFDDVFEVAEQRTVAGKHSKLVLQRRGADPPLRFAAILFDHVDSLPTTIRAVYRPDPNEWNGTVALQLVVEHWEPAVDSPR